MPTLLAVGYCRTITVIAVGDCRIILLSILAVGECKTISVLAVGGWRPSINNCRVEFHASRTCCMSCEHVCGIDVHTFINAMFVNCVFR